MRWNRRLAFLLSTPYIATIAAFATCAALYADRALERQQLETVADQTLGQARMAANTLPWDPNDEGFPERCRALVSGTGARLTIIRPDGTVLCDSAAAAATVEDLLGRPEVRDALEQGSGQSIRRSATTGADLLYRALLQTRGREQRIVRLAVPISTLNTAYRRIRYVLILTLAVAAVIGLWPVVRISQRLARRLDALVQFTQAVGADRPSSPPTPQRTDALGRLEANLADMGREVRRRVDSTREEEHKLRAVLAGMVEGVLVVSERGELVLLNERAREIFGLDETEDYTGRPLVEICRDPELQQLIRDTIQMSPSVARLARELSLAAEPPRVLAVNAASVRGNRGAMGFVLVFHEITEIKKLEAVRRDFVANVSHELRTPLTAIRGYAETLLGGAVDDAQVARRFLGVIERNAERLTRLIDDLLALSDLELGRLGLQRASVPVAAAVDAAFEVVGEKARRGGVTLRHEVPADLRPIDGDADRVEQVLVNLIDNAVKYTPHGGSVTVQARLVTDGDRDNGAARPPGAPTAASVEVAVADTGIGIPSQDLPRLTERFYRVDKARSRELGGTGLGLAIVKHIVQAHGGWLRIDSVLGKGTTVRVTFPAATRGPTR